NRRRGQRRGIRDIHLERQLLALDLDYSTPRARRQKALVVLSARGFFRACGGSFFARRLVAARQEKDGEQDSQHRLDQAHLELLRSGTGIARKYPAPSDADTVTRLSEA